MKLTKSQLKKIIKEELLNEFMDLSDPISKVKEAMSKFEGDLGYHAAGSYDGDAYEYEGHKGLSLFKKRHAALTKWQQNFDKVLKKALNDYKKAWK